MYDLAIIGGGVNGCGIARDASGRGLQVVLAEMGDLAGATSSSSTKLVHGGLRYLEQYEFGLVRESLKEREVLLAMAPHIIKQMRFVLPHHKGLRPALLIRIGLFLYDHLGGRKILPPSRQIDLTRDPAGVPLKPEFKRGFEYSDCWVDDARLVVLNAMDAAARGADIRVRTEVLAARRQDDHWLIDMRDGASGSVTTIAARVLVNAAGPWVADTITRRLGLNSSARVRLVKGSHIVVQRRFEHDRAYIFQNSDHRVVFAIPYERDFTLIGTTDVEYRGDPAKAAASDDEIKYLCAAANNYFKSAIHPHDVAWSYSGVRPLFDDGDAAAQEVTRDYKLERQGQPGEPVLLNVFGGKITTYRHLAEEALAKLNDIFPAAHGVWTKGAALPGGDFAVDGMSRLVAQISDAHPFIGQDLAARLARSYGTRSHKILAGAKNIVDLGAHFGAGLYQREVEYLIQHEWARNAEDILWRRSKLGLHLTPPQRKQLAAWVAEHSALLIASAA